MAHTTNAIARKLRRKSLKKAFPMEPTKPKTFKALPTELTEKEGMKIGHLVGWGLATGITVLLALAFTLGG
jgi:hypothetical protein